MATHRIEIKKHGSELSAVCWTHAQHFPRDTDDSVAVFNGYREAIDAGWRKLQRRMICPDCGRKEGIS